MAMTGLSICAIAATFMPVGNAAEEETVGNNLSIPLLYSESAYLPPITTPVTEQFTGAIQSGYVVARDLTSAECAGALQKDAGNVWQGDLALAEDGSVTTVDWGDNLEAMDPNLSRAYTRVEMGLYSALAEPATGYDMCWISGRGTNEVWGAQVVKEGDSWVPVTSDRTEAAVYTAGARLTIQRIVPDRTYTWSADTHRWQGTGADAPYFNGAVHEAAADGPGSFGAEVTVTGKLSYGYLWDTATVPQGEYRLTFSLDGAMDGFEGSGTTLSNASILASEETSSEDVSATAEGSGNTATMRGDLNLTYIDVTVGTRTDPIPTDEPTTPPSGGGTSSGSTSTGSTTSGGAASSVPGPEGPSAGQGPVSVAITPAAGTVRLQQHARIRAAERGTYPVGRRLLLAARPVKTDAGVTVRWRIREQDRDQCQIRLRDGQTTVKLVRPGTCTVIGWAPAPSEQYAPFRWTRTYRAVAQQ